MPAHRRYANGRCSALSGWLSLVSCLVMLAVSCRVQADNKSGQAADQARDASKAPAQNLLHPTHRQPTGASATEPNTGGTGQDPRRRQHRLSQHRLSRQHLPNRHPRTGEDC